MSTTRYKPTAIFDPGSFTNLSGGTASHADIDDDPDSPNTGDGVKETGYPTQTDSLNLSVEPPVGSLDSPVSLVARIHGHCTGAVSNVAIQAMYLLDESSTVAAQYTGVPIGFGTGDAAHELPLAYTPGSFDWSTARLVVNVTWDDYSDLFIYAVDYVVHDDPPPDPDATRAAFFVLLTSP